MQNVPLTATKIHFVSTSPWRYTSALQDQMLSSEQQYLQSNLALQKLKAHQRFIRLQEQSFCQISPIPGQQTAHITVYPAKNTQ